jgi:hypothetical protein
MTASNPVMPDQTILFDAASSGRSGLRQARGDGGSSRSTIPPISHGTVMAYSIRRLCPKVRSCLSKLGPQRGDGNKVTFSVEAVTEVSGSRLFGGCSQIHRFPQRIAPVELTSEYEERKAHYAHISDHRATSRRWEWLEGHDEMRQALGSFYRYDDE